MPKGIADVVRDTLIITSFVFVMMLIIEYVNVLTRGTWERQLCKRRWRQYLLAVILGVMPGCLGAFAVVSMYAHRSLSLGAVVAAMVATSGDESFVMLAMIPKEAIFLFAVLSVLGFAAGALTDLISGGYTTLQPAGCEGFEVHREEVCHCFPGRGILAQWKNCTPARGILACGLALFVLALITGQIGPSAWTWLRATLLVTSAAALFIVSTVPDHFLDEHLWRHVALRHVPRVFLWTFAALIVMYFLTERLHLENAIWKGKWIILVVSCLVGLIPESGPHLVFVSLYAQGAVPFSILLASSAVQDGHGMLPMLAHSRRAFLGIKAINFLAGLGIGAAAMAMGY